MSFRLPVLLGLGLAVTAYLAGGLALLVGLALCAGSVSVAGLLMGDA